MKRRQWRKILSTPQLTLHQAAKEPQTYSVRWKKPNGHYGERIFQAPNTQEACNMAPAIAGFVPLRTYEEILPIDKALSETLKRSKRGFRSRQDWKSATLRFARWLVAHHPGIGNWNQLTRFVIREYFDSLNGRSSTTRRLALQPLIQTDNYLHREYGLPLIAQNLRIGTALAKQPARVHFADVLDLLGYLRSHHPKLEAGVALQGLAALRPSEAHGLTWDRIDLERGFIEISRQVKNQWSERVIPVPALALQILQRADRQRQTAKIRCIDSEPLTPEYRTSEAYSKLVSSAIREWSSQIPWRSKDLRNALPTWATSNGCHNDLWEQYMGHAPKGVTATHYVPRLGGTRGQQHELDQAMEAFRAHVTILIDQAITQIQEKKKRDVGG